jgi:hypothetical protein
VTIVCFRSSETMSWYVRSKKPAWSSGSGASGLRK